MKILSETKLVSDHSSSSTAQCVHDASTGNTDVVGIRAPSQAIEAAELRKV